MLFFAKIKNSKLLRCKRFEYLNIIVSECYEIVSSGIEKCKILYYTKSNNKKLSTKGGQVMDFKSIKQIREWLIIVKDVGDVLQEKGWIDLPDNLKFNGALEYDLMRFFGYLIASDGYVGRGECDMFTAITGYECGIDSLKELIEDNNLYSYDFESTPPISLKLLINALNKYIVQDPDKDELVGTTIGAYIATFALSGLLVISSDQSVTYTEKNDLRTYCQTIEGYIRTQSYVELPDEFKNILDNI